MTLSVVGISYQTAEIEIREKLAFEESRALKIAEEILSTQLVYELVILSTCNRTEWYFVGDEETVHEILSKHASMTYQVFKRHTYTYQGISVARHLMRVVSGLDSMVIGEREIFGQAKQALQNARDSQIVGKHLDRLFQKSFSVAKEIRTSTGIGDHPISIAYLAAKMSQTLFADVARITVAIIGAGKVAKDMAKYLYHLGVRRFYFSNKTQSTAEDLAKLYQGRVFSWQQALPLEELDLIVAATNSPQFLMGFEGVHLALAARKRKPMMILDLGVPRNIDPELVDSEDVYLYTIDDLEAQSARNRLLRYEAKEVAEQLIDSTAIHYMKWLKAQASIQTLVRFREKFGKIRDGLVTEGLQRLRTGEDPEVVFRRFATRLTNRLLHEPTRSLREAGVEERQDVLDITHRIFRLDHEVVDTE